MKPGTIINVPNYGPATVVYHNLDGYGVIPGRRVVDEANLPAPEAMLRDHYPSATLPCIGREYTIEPAAIGGGAGKEGASQGVYADLERAKSLLHWFIGYCNAELVGEHHREDESWWKTMDAKVKEAVAFCDESNAATAALRKGD